MEGKLTGGMDERFKLPQQKTTVRLRQMLRNRYKPIENSNPCHDEAATFHVRMCLICGPLTRRGRKVLFNCGTQKLKRRQHFYAYIYLNNIVDTLADLSKVRERIQLRKGQESKIGLN